MRFFFIDLENVRSNGLEGVISLEADDQVLVFYSENANNLTIPTLENINNSKATVKFINTNFVGSNAMDFQIVSLLGAMIERHKQGFFSIISHDNGFKSALTFCERYFSDYPISVGKFDNIISAIAYDLKHPIKGSAEGGNGAIKKKKKGNNSASGQGERDDKAVITGRKEAHAEATAQSQPEAQQEQAAPQPKRKRGATVAAADRTREPRRTLLRKPGILRKLFRRDPICSIYTTISRTCLALRPLTYMPPRFMKHFWWPTPRTNFTNSLKISAVKTKAKLSSSYCTVTSKT